MSRISELILEAESNPNDYKKWFELGKYAVDRYVTVIGLEAMKNAADLEPTNPDVLDYYARVLNRARHLEDAASVYRRAIELDPNSPTIWTGYSVVQGHLGRRDETERCCRKALEIDSGCAWAVFSLIPRLGLSGRITEILPLIRKAISSNRSPKPGQS